MIPRWQDKQEAEGSLWGKVYTWVTYFISPDQLGYLIAIVTASIVRAMGITIKSGETALLFSFGRARRELDPGFHLLLPFLQVARRMPSRSRTLDLPSQRVVTTEGLVYHVDANLVYRIIDVHRAVVEIDHLEKGMLQLLGLSVQETLREMGREDMLSHEKLGKLLKKVLSDRLSDWGVVVEQAGFPSITPSAMTLRVTQFGRKTGERVRALQLMTSGQLEQEAALALMGSRTRFESRTKRLARLAEQRGVRRRIRKALIHEGIPAGVIGALEKWDRRRFRGERASTMAAETDSGEAEE